MLRVCPLFVVICAVACDATKTGVICDTTKGPLTIELFPGVSPIGVQRFQQLVEENFLTSLPMFRMVPGFLMQAGPKPGGSPFDQMDIQDDQPHASERVFTRGMIAFAGSGPNSRTDNFFIAFCAQCSSLGTNPWETPIGQLVGQKSMDVLTAIEHGQSYGDMPPWGNGPAPKQIQEPNGAAFLKNFPQLDYYKSCRNIVFETN